MVNDTRRVTIASTRNELAYNRHDRPLTRFFSEKEESSCSRRPSHSLSEVLLGSNVKRRLQGFE